MAGESEAVTVPPPAPNCPFYGYHAILNPFGHGFIPRQKLLFVASDGNQCALVMWAYQPCALDLVGKPVDWRGCSLWAVATYRPLEKH
jgi:hypothetical protein